MVKSPSAAASASASATAEQRSTNEVKYKGVRKRKWGKYVSEIRLPNSRDRIWLGSYETAERAARAFDAALFCLRGHNAKFNFPNDPPNMVGCQSLTPAEIQAVAQHYGNQPRTTSPPPSGEGGGDGSKAVAVEEDMSPLSNSEGAEPMDTIDWSFLDVLDSDRVGNAGHVSDFGLFHEPVDMYMPSSHLAERCDDEDDNDGSGNYGGNVQSFLWNF